MLDLAGEGRYSKFNPNFAFKLLFVISLSPLPPPDRGFFTIFTGLAVPKNCTIYLIFPEKQYFTLIFLLDVQLRKYTIVLHSLMENRHEGSR